MANEPIDAKSEDAGVPAVLGQNTGAGVGVGVKGTSQSGFGVIAESGLGVGLSAKGGRLAGFFEGHVQVTGDFRGAHVIADNIDVTGHLRGSEVIANSLSVNNVQFQTVVEQINILRGDIAHLPNTNTAALQNQLNTLQTQLNNLQNQFNTAVSTLQGRITITEVQISDLKARVTALGG